MLAIPTFPFFLKASYQAQTLEGQLELAEHVRLAEQVFGRRPQASVGRNPSAEARGHAWSADARRRRHQPQHEVARDQGHPHEHLKAIKLVFYFIL